MADYLKNISQRWVILSKRDRLMLFMVGLFAILGLMDTYLTDPVRQQKQVTEAEVVRLQADTAKVQVQIAQLKASNTQSNSPLRQEISQLKTQIAAQEALLHNLGSMMVSPQQMTGVMKQLLQQHAEVKVVSMESVAPVSFINKHLQASGTAASPESADVGIGILYQHTVKLKLEGGYLALMHYVADLKARGAAIAWEAAELKASYPKTELMLEIYTLSTEKAWLGI